MTRLVHPCTPLCVLLTALSMSACMRQSAVAVEPKRCAAACAGSSASQPTDAGQLTMPHEAGAADGGKTLVGAGDEDDASFPAALDSGAALPAVDDFTLVVDAPHEGAMLDGSVTISGRSARFVNVEVWDAMHQMPPLARTTPRADGTFTVRVDVSALPPGPVTWTVWGWDSPAGQSFAHTASVTLHLTLR